MSTKWTFRAVVALCLLPSVRAYSAGVAVMPVQGVNLGQGECDAIGVTFANAFARDAHVAVVSPLEAKPIRSQTLTAAATAEKLGVSLYVELTAIHLRDTVKLAGVLYRKDGTVVYRAETRAPSMEDVGSAAAILAHALIFRQPPPAVVETDVPDVSAQSDPTPEPAVDPATIGAFATGYPDAIGFKGLFVMPSSSGRAFSPLVGLQFDARFGPRGYFLEIGGGLAVPLDRVIDSSAGGQHGYFGFVDVGAGVFLWPGQTALYLAGGLSPGVWASDNYGGTNTSATIALHGQLGLTLNRDRKRRVFMEIQVSQFLLAVSAPPPSSIYGSEQPSPGAYRPTLLAVQVGVGF